MALHVRIVSRAAELFNGEADYVAVPAAAGSLGVLPGRQPVLAALRGGPVVIHEVGGKETTIEVGTGFVSVDDDVVEIVVDEKLSD